MDAQILADTYLNLTGGQVTFNLTDSQTTEIKQDVDKQAESIEFLEFNAKEKDLNIRRYL